MSVLGCAVAFISLCTDNYHGAVDLRVSHGPAPQCPRRAAGHSLAATVCTRHVDFREIRYRFYLSDLFLRCSTDQKRQISSGLVRNRGDITLTAASAPGRREKRRRQTTWAGDIQRTPAPPTETFRRGPSPFAQDQPDQQHQ